MPPKDRTEASPESESNAEPRSGKNAAEIHAEFVERRRAGDIVHLDEYCERFPAQANALRALDSLLEGGDSEETLGETHPFAAEVADLPATEGGTFGGDNRGATGVPLAVGDRVGPYVVEKLLGEGGFAFVFRAQQLSPVRRAVALKTLKLGLDTKQVITRFEAERQALALMSHSHIARVFDAGVTVDGRPYFAMEYVGGQPLTDYCDRKCLKTPVRLELFLRVCAAVEHAHQRAVIHRDLKPSNVLVTEEGGTAVPKVIDFGIAKATGEPLAEQTLQTQAGQIMGTPEYMSPEQAAGGNIDTRTDVYALGIILYELLCGARPLDKEKLRTGTIFEILRAICEEEPVTPSTRLEALGSASIEIAKQRNSEPRQLQRELRGDLDWITLRALAKDPDQRYASVSELSADVRRHLDLKPVVAGPPTVRYRLGKLLKRHRQLLVTLLLLVLTALAVTIGFIGKDHQTTRELLADGDRWVQTARRTRLELNERTASYRKARDAIETWASVWHRDTELAAFEHIAPVRLQLEKEYSLAFASLQRGVERAGVGSRPWSRGVTALKLLAQDIRQSDEVSLASVMLRLQLSKAIESGTASLKWMERSSTPISIATDPPGAQVYCFRYEQREQRLLPVPFDSTAGATEPTQGLLATPRLRIARVYTPARVRGLRLDVTGKRRPGALRPGDRIHQVNHQPVHLVSDFAKALEGIAADSEVTLRVERAISETDEVEAFDFVWVPFRSQWYDPTSTARARAQDATRPGRTDCTYHQFGFNFEAYPLEFPRAALLGETSMTQPTVQANLPTGSYLLVCRKEGHIDTRYPLRLPTEGAFEHTLPLPTRDAVPPGFVYIPPGRFVKGGDDPFYRQTLPYGESSVPSYFLSRHEVTFGEYLPFFLSRSDSKGRAIPRTPEAKGAMSSLNSPFLSLLPLGAELKTRTQAVSWMRKRPDRPLFGVSAAVAFDYAAWRTQEDRGGWRYRLPTDLEWEKAARGADGRTYVWGDYMVWSFCQSLPGSHRLGGTTPPRYGGVSAFDESVFGVHDLAGSVSEFTSDETIPGYLSKRGGDWSVPDENPFRTSTREGFKAAAVAPGFGIRLVAERDATSRL